MLSPQIKRSPINPRTSYSSKLFVGAVPPGTSEHILRRAMTMFGEAEITWPNKNVTHSPMQGRVFLCNISSVTFRLRFCHFQRCKIGEQLVDAMHDGWRRKVHVLRSGNDVHGTFFINSNDNIAVLDSNHSVCFELGHLCY